MICCNPGVICSIGACLVDSKATYPHLIHALNTMRTSRTRITQRIHAQSACTMCLPVSYTCMHVHGSAKCRFAIKSVRGVSRQDSKPIRIENHGDFEESEKSRDSWRAENQPVELRRVGFRELTRVESHTTSRRIFEREDDTCDKVDVPLGASVALTITRVRWSWQ